MWGVALRGGAVTQLSLSSDASQASRRSVHSEADAGAGPDAGACPRTPDARSQGTAAEAPSPAEAGAGPRAAVEPAAPVEARVLELPFSQALPGELAAAVALRDGDPDAPVPQEAVLAAPILQRRRLRGKQSDAPAFEQRANKLEEALQEVRRREEDLLNEPLEQRRALRDWLRKIFCEREQRRSGMTARAARSEYAVLTRAAKLDLVRFAIATEPIPEGLWQDVLRTLAVWSVVPADEDEEDDAENESGPQFACTATLLLTWQGQWGRVGVGEPYATSLTVDALTEELQDSAHVEVLWTRALEGCRRHADHLGVKRWTASLELCTRTWEREKRVQLHLHMFLQSGRCKIRVGKAQQLSVLGVAPFRSVTGGERGSSLSKNAGAGHFYLSIPKIGMIKTFGTVEIFKDYTVNPQWINNFFSQDKITAEGAKDLLLRCKRDVKRHLENVDTVVRLNKQRRMAVQHAVVRQRLQGGLGGRKRVPEVDDVWLEEQQQERMRQRFLVLEGPSGVGKTVYATALVGPDESLDVNCANCLDPDLRDLDVERHKLILFDEASTQMVLNNKKLFQAPSVPVKLGQSATNIHSYEVWVGQKLLVVASNRWSEELEKHSPADRAWLQANSVHVKVTEPLWVSCGDAAGGAASQPDAAVAAAGG